MGRFGGRGASFMTPRMEPPPPSSHQAKLWVEGFDSGGKRRWGVPGEGNGPPPSFLSPPGPPPSAGARPTDHPWRQPPRTDRGGKLGWAGPEERRGRRPRASSSSSPRGPRPALLCALSSSPPRAGSRSAPGHHHPAPDVRQEAGRQGPADAPGSGGAGRRPMGCPTATARPGPRLRHKQRASPPMPAAPSEGPRAVPRLGCTAPQADARRENGLVGRACSAGLGERSSPLPPAQSAVPSCEDDSDPRTANTVPLLGRRRSATEVPGEEPPPRLPHTSS